MIFKKPSVGTWRPITTRHTVRGVDSNNPIGPQISDQKMAANKTANEEIPVWAPYSNGSNTFATSSSTTRYSNRVYNGLVQVAKMASESKIGKTAASGDPMYGRKRKR